MGIGRVPADNDGHPMQMQNDTSCGDPNERNEEEAKPLYTDDCETSYTYYTPSGQVVCCNGSDQAQRRVCCDEADADEDLVKVRSGAVPLSRSSSLPTMLGSSAPWDSRGDSLPGRIILSTEGGGTRDDGIGVTSFGETSLSNCKCDCSDEACKLSCRCGNAESSKECGNHCNGPGSVLPQRSVLRFPSKTLNELVSSRSACVACL